MLPKLFFISMLSLLILTHSYSHQCVDHQKRLLLELKNELIFNSSISIKLVQWNRSDDCCKWYGVGCDGAGNVMSLRLDGESISDGIGESSSLFRLEYLQRLNLAFNDFNSIPIPRGIHNLTYLTHLNLSYAGFGGQVPAQLSSLTRLVSLDISYNYWPQNLELPNLEMLVSNLTGLRELYLDAVNITSSDERRKWSHIISSYLPNLTTLSLVGSGLSGPLAKSFWQLHSMSILRLDLNDLSAINPDLFANFPYLTTLSLAMCKLNGYFPETIFCLPTLQNLDLSLNEQLSVSMSSFIGETGYSIKSIVLMNTNFTRSLPSSIRNVKSLSEINLSGCKLTGSIPSIFANLTQLVDIDLSDNFFTGSLSLFEGLSNLVYLNLDGNSFSGTIPHFFFYLPSLKRLSLSENKFNGQVDEFSLVNVSKIEYLDLSGNRLEGPIPNSFFQLDSLYSLELQSNMFNGTLQILDKIQSLPNLRYIDLSDNNLSLDFGNHNSSTYQLPHLQALYLSSCNLSAFPDFIQHSDLKTLDLSNNRIVGEIPIWIWKSQLWYLNLSPNLLTDFQKPYHISASLRILDLHSNQLRGELQLPLPSNNGNDITSQGLSCVLIGNNSLSGSIPISLCSATYLKGLDLSLNKLSGNIPLCLLQNTTSLSVLDLGRNNISGLIADHFPINCPLRYLDLNNNNLQGKIPKSLQNCKWLELMNIGENMIEDTFPCMLPSNLSVVVLHSNRFHGEVKCQTNWPHLQILDISSNNFNGTLESFNFSTWNAMVKDNNAEFMNYYLGTGLLRSASYYTGGIRITMKGLEVQLVKIWPDFTAIDFSCNNFGGEIPFAIGNLSSFRLLNLSHNALHGSIPKSIYHLRVLESLDLSQNSLTGVIPEELAGLTFLSVLNLSHNKLVGKIPNDRHLQTFSADSFKGNPGLCGFNLNISCTYDHNDDDTDKVEVEEEKREIEWGYVIAALGYVVGLGSISWLLLFCRSFRKKCFDKIDDVVEYIFNARDMRRRKHATERRRLARNREVRRR